MPRIALGIEYHGARYYGWQRQAHNPSIQAHLESALCKVASKSILTYCAGRTDAGVHATNQVVHFDFPETSSARPLVAWVRGVNTYLPPDIRVLWAQEVDSDFDARKSALFRRYLYLFINQAVKPGIMHDSITWVLPTLDHHLMHQGAQYLVGEHDFTSFRAAQCQAKTPVRRLHAIEVVQKGNCILLDVTANAFLHHMVRNIAGSLLLVGQGKFSPEWMKTLLEVKDRRQAGMMAPPDGLYLAHVSYHSKFGIPNQPRYPWFL
jgi:tRNA pseudouridine38-40 synthase